MDPKRVIYLAHPLNAPTREGIEANRKSAARWAAFLATYFDVAPECSWIVLTGELEETPARARGSREGQAADRGGAVVPGFEASVVSTKLRLVVKTKPAELRETWELDALRRFRELRLKRYRSQIECALALGVDDSTVDRWESGASKVPGWALVALEKEAA